MWLGPPWKQTSCRHVNFNGEVDTFPRASEKNDVTYDLVITLNLTYNIYEYRRRALRRGWQVELVTRDASSSETNDNGEDADGDDDDDTEERHETLSRKIGAIEWRTIYRGPRFRVPAYTREIATRSRTNGLPWRRWFVHRRVNDRTRGWLSTRRREIGKQSPIVY